MQTPADDPGGPTLESDGSWVGNLLDQPFFARRKDAMHSIAYAWLYQNGDYWQFKPVHCPNNSQFYNAVFFARLNWPFGIFASFRWSASKTKNSMFQFGIGWKLNGRIGGTFRVESDASSAAGVKGPNLGQSTGFDLGPH